MSEQEPASRLAMKISAIVDGERPDYVLTALAVTFAAAFGSNNDTLWRNARKFFLRASTAVRKDLAKNAAGLPQ